MFICPESTSFIFFRYLVLAILSITLVQGFRSASNMNISNLLDLNGHIKAKQMSKSQSQSHMNYSSLEPVLFEKLNNIKLSRLIFRVTTFFQFNSTKAALSILFHYAHDFNENLKTLYSKLVTNNDFDHKTYDVNQHILTYLDLLKLYSDELPDCKFQIMHFTSQINNIFATLDQTGQNASYEL